MRRALRVVWFSARAVYDDLLIIETTITEVSKLKCKFSYRILRKEEGNDRLKLLVKGYTVHAAITKEGKLTRLPEEIIQKISKFSQNCIKPNNSLN